MYRGRPNTLSGMSPRGALLPSTRWAEAALAGAEPVAGTSRSTSSASSQ